jgi:hypothetical protein
MLPEKKLEALKHRAEEELARNGTARTHLGYNVLVKITMDELLLNNLREDSVPRSEPVLRAMAVEEMHDEDL